MLGSMVAILYCTHLKEKKLNQRTERTNGNNAGVHISLTRPCLATFCISYKSDAKLIGIEMKRVP